MKFLSLILIWTGFVLCVGATLFLIVIYYPLISEEVSYLFSSQGKNTVVVGQGDLVPKNKKIIIPRDENFGIVIPKIDANARIIQDVDPFDPAMYEKALAKGVAQAKGSAYPGEIGNVFLFAHSSVNFYEATRYNSIFYLLTNVEKNDEIYIFYKKIKYRYKVFDIKIVDASDISYLKSIDPQRYTLTLMACWPAGTSFRRLLVLAKI